MGTSEHGESSATLIVQYNINDNFSRTRLSRELKFSGLVHNRIPIMRVKFGRKMLRINEVGSKIANFHVITHFSAST